MGYLVVFALTSCLYMFGDRINVRRLPLSRDDVKILNLDEKFRAILSNEKSAVPSVVFNETTRDSKLADWFLSELDAKFEVVEIAQRKNRLYLVLSSKSKNEPGRLFLPLYPSPSNALVDRIEKWKKSIPNLDSGSIAVVELLRDSFDSIDVERTFFGVAGERATGSVDFSRARKLGHDWQDSRVLFISLGGDTLLLRKDKHVAWCRLETGEILEVGRFEDAIIRYLGSVREDDVFSSFTDRVIRDK